MNKEFCWTDELVKKYIKLYTRNWWRGDITDKEIQEFKESEMADPVLFTTQDGVDIFNKNELLYVVEHARDVHLFESKSTAGSIRGILKYFYYKEPAEQYVILHKPCVSISEVIDAGPAHDIDPVLKNNLMKLVKKKIEGK